MKKLCNSKYDLIFSEEVKLQIIKDYVDNEFSIRNICDKYNIKCKDWVQKFLKPYIRSTEDARKIANRKMKNHFKHSEETKEKIRQKRLDYLSKHPECTAWRRAKLSYPEKLFIEYLKSRLLDLKYIIEREKSMFPYYIDFAFNDIKVAVEIDGSQHLLPEKQESDNKKDLLLINNGWQVIRITENVVKTDWEQIDNILLKAINFELTNSLTIVGIIKSPKTRLKAVRDENGKTVKLTQSAFNQRKVKDRPSLETLEELLITNSYVKVGKLYGVSDRTIKNWIRQYKKTK